jgi:hypothetical protein
MFFVTHTCGVFYCSIPFMTLIHQRNIYIYIYVCMYLYIHLYFWSVEKCLSLKGLFVRDEVDENLKYCIKRDSVTYTKSLNVLRFVEQII